MTSRNRSEPVEALRFTVAAPFLWAVLALACSDQPEEQVECFSTSEQSLYLGSPDAGSPELEAQLFGAIGRVYSFASLGGTLLDTCTATRISSEWVLTAAHCVRQDTDHVEVDFRLDQRSPDCTMQASSAATERIPHPEMDLLLLRLERGSVFVIDPSSEFEVETGNLLMAGFGVTETGTHGRLEFLGTRLMDQSDGWLRVNAGQDRGACFGDSGGPLLALAADGSPRVIGVLSRGSRSCSSDDEYVGLERALPWLHDHTGVLE